MRGANREDYERSFTRHCFSSTPFCGSVGWDATWGDGGPALNQNPQIRRLLELEYAVTPVPLWAQLVARQVDQLPPCGWSFPQHLEAVCTNIGRNDAAAAKASGCYTPGPNRLAMLSRVALLLDAWLKKIPSGRTAMVIASEESSSVDWSCVAENVWKALGEHEPRKRLLVLRLLERLRFWLRAPYEGTKLDDNFRLGFLMVPKAGWFGGWDYFGFDYNEPSSKDLDSRIRSELDAPQQGWLDWIYSTWPCAPKVMRFIERTLAAIGKIAANDTSSIKALSQSLPPASSILPVNGTYLDTETSRQLYNTALQALGERIQDDFPLPAKLPDAIDGQWSKRLSLLLGESNEVKLWLESLLFERIALFEEEFKSFHFTLSRNHAYGQ